MMPLIVNMKDIKQRVSGCQDCQALARHVLRTIDIFDTFSDLTIKTYSQRQSFQR